MMEAPVNSPFPADELPDSLTLVLRGPLAELVFNAPARKNALPLSAWSALPEAARRIACAPEVRVCVLRGAGGSFCAGADISEFETVRARPDDAERYDAINVAAFKALKALPMPVIAAIEGPCLGGGLGLALACDLRIAAPSAVFAIPAARLGLAYPPEALHDLLAAVSPGEAKKLLFTAARLDAAEAMRIGLVSEVTTDGGLESRIADLCATLCANAPLSLKAAKQAIDRLEARTPEDALDDLRAAARACIDSDDYAEGCRAFLDKRPPRFHGR